MAGLYHSAGWVNIDFVLNRDKAKFIFIVGARGTGKTYGALKYMKENDANFVLLRRTAKEVQAIKTDRLNPYSALNQDLGTEIKLWRLTQDIALIADTTYNQKGKAIAGTQRGIAVALSTFATIRSISSEQTKYIVYDEFIPESHVRQIKDEAAAFFNFYESINRNRELKGQPAVKALCMANSSQLANPYYMELGLVQKAADLQKKGKNYAYFPKEQIALYDLSDSPISKLKKDTFLYQATQGSSFHDMAVDNIYTDVLNINIKTQLLSQYAPIIRVGELTIYKAKNNQNPYSYYVSPHNSGSPSIFGSSSKELSRFRRIYPIFKILDIDNKICYENEVAQVLFNKYIGFDE